MAKKKTKTSTKSTKKTATKSLADHRFFGIWKDRPEWKGLKTPEIAAKLRAKTVGREKPLA